MYFIAHGYEAPRKRDKKKRAHDLLFEQTASATDSTRHRAGLSRLANGIRHRQPDAAVIPAPPTPTPPPPATAPAPKRHRLTRALLATCAFLLAGGAIVGIARLEQSRQRSHWDGGGLVSNDANKLHQILRARITAESDHPEGFPAEALTDVYAYAAYLARIGCMPDAKFWFSHVDPAVDSYDSIPQLILLPAPAGQPAPINPAFQNAPLAIAVALIPIVTGKNVPMTTPIAWTRGLQADGTWAQDSPFGGSGGYVAFAGDYVQRYRGTLAGRLVKWGTTEPTSNIYEALPPGTRIGDYTQTPAHLQHLQQMQQLKVQYQPIIFATMTGLFLLVLGSGFFVTRPRSEFPDRLPGIIVGLFCAGLFWGDLIWGVLQI